MGNFRMRVSEEEMKRFEEMAPQFGLTWKDFYSFCASYGLKVFEIMAQPSPTVLRLISEFEKDPQLERAGKEMVREHRRRKKEASVKK